MLNIHVIVCCQMGCHNGTLLLRSLFRCELATRWYDISSAIAYEGMKLNDYRYLKISNNILHTILSYDTVKGDRLRQAMSSFIEKHNIFVNHTWVEDDQHQLDQVHNHSSVLNCVFATDRQAALDAKHPIDKIVINPKDVGNSIIEAYASDALKTKMARTDNKFNREAYTLSPVESHITSNYITTDKRAYEIVTPELYHTTLSNTYNLKVRNYIGNDHDG